MNSELAWLAMPLVGLLSQIGGTYNKLYRRIGVPSVITLVSFLLVGFQWWLPVLFILIFVVTTLPFTLKGDSLYSHWFNWVWIWILGYLLGLPSVLLGWKGALYSLVPCFTQGILGTISNIRGTAHLAQWKMVEGLVYIAMAYPYLELMTTRS
jgi:hypothetical protein